MKQPSKPSTSSKPLKVRVETRSPERLAKNSGKGNKAASKQGGTKKGKKRLDDDDDDDWVPEAASSQSDGSSHSGLYSDEVKFKRSYLFVAHAA